MKNIMRYILVVLLTVSVFGFSGQVQAGENNSIFQQAYHEKQALTGGRSSIVSSSDGRSDGSVNASGSVTAIEASWITVDVPRPKDYRVHDFVTIIVNEVSKSRTKAKSRLQRENTIEAVLEDWVRLDNGRLRPDSLAGGDLAVTTNFDREFKARGQNDREDMLTVRITAEVVDVMPNGNLVLEATKTVKTDEDVTKVTLTGMCRSSDIGADNSIISSKLARMDISKTHTGGVYGATRRGWLDKILDVISPL